MSPGDPLHNQHYDQQGKELDVSGRTVRRAVKSYHTTARRYKTSQIKRISSANKSSHIEDGQEHRKKTLRGFWRWLYFSDEAHFNSLKLYTKLEWELQEAGAKE
jgi:osmotically-inducible protein OsmY